MLAQVKAPTFAAKTLCVPDCKLPTSCSLCVPPLINIGVGVQNVPADSAWYLTVLGNPIVGTVLPAVVACYVAECCVAVTIVKLVAQIFLVPRMSSVLARVKYGIQLQSTPGPELIVKVHETQVLAVRQNISFSMLLSQISTAILFEVITVLFAPMISVLILDEVSLLYHWLSLC